MEADACESVSIPAKAEKEISRKTANPSGKAEIDWIQGLRGLACILVVLTHARYFMLDTPSWELSNQLFMPGAMGVDLFFVISGFIMVYTTTGTRTSTAGSFLIKRATRIWPPYAVMTIVWVLA